MNLGHRQTHTQKKVFHFLVILSDCVTNLLMLAVFISTISQTYVCRFFMDAWASTKKTINNFLTKKNSYFDCLYTTFIILDFVIIFSIKLSDPNKRWFCVNYSSTFDMFTKFKLFQSCFCAFGFVAIVVHLINWMSKKFRSSWC